MEFYESIKIILAKCFYFPNQMHIFNMKRLLAILAGLFIVVTQFAFLFCDADSITEYVSSAYMTVSALGIFISLIDTTLKTETIFKLIDNDIEVITKRSESRLFISFFRAQWKYSWYRFQARNVQNRSQFIWKPIGLWKNSVKL